MIASRVTIALATYFPEEKYFRKQLQSLNCQTYNEIELIVCDDSADEVQFEIISKIVQAEITKFPSRIIKNEQNAGSNKTFERLTEAADSEFIAYADQDDIWHHDKIEKLVSLVKSEGAILAYSDLRLINDDDDVSSESMLRSSFRMEHVRGENTFSYLIENNSVTGCAMLIRTEAAKSALPFPTVEYYVHDHWLAISASSHGIIAYSEEPLVDYRIHSNNQVGVKRSHNLDTVEKYVQANIKIPLERVGLIETQMELDNSKFATLYSRKLSLEFRLHKYNKDKVHKLSDSAVRSKSAFESFLFASPRPMQDVILKTKNSFVKKLTLIINKVRTRN